MQWCSSAVVQQWCLLLLQVGQLDVQGLCQAYLTLGSVEVKDTQLLAALHKAVRPKLNVFKPAQLTSLLVGLAALGSQDALLLDIIAK